MTTSAQSDNRTVAQRYRLDRVVGRGAMGAVWQAEDTVLHRTVALKEVVLPPGLSREDRAVACERTLREARAIARLAHPNVVTLYDVVEEDKRPWVVMELVKARSLAQVLKEDGPLDPVRAAKVGLAVLGALQAAHEASITHRDVKPGNILVGEDELVKLTDFGIARAAGDMTLTGTGLLVGSPSYMAPEVVRGEALGPTADLFGLGATLYCAVEGHPPFSGGDALSTLNMVVAEPPKPYKRAGGLRPVLDGLLEKDPRTRLTAIQARQMLLDAVRDNGAGGAPVTPRRLPADRSMPPPPNPRATQAMMSPPPARGGGWGPNGPAHPPPAMPTLLPTGETDNRYRDRDRDPFAVQRTRTRNPRSIAKIATGIGLCIVLAVGGVVLSRTLSGDKGSNSSNTSQTNQTNPKDEDVSPGSVPDGYQNYTDPDGRFTAAVPQGWTEHKLPNAMELKAPDGDLFMRLYDLKGNKPRSVFGEASFRKRVDDYERISLDDVDYRDFGATDWEFTYTRDDGQVRHVLWRGFVHKGRFYGIYLSAPNDSFDDNKKYFDTAAGTFDLT